jgi:hypothetical protein
MKAYIIIEKQYSQDLAIEYPSVEDALWALENSLMIEGECQDDCLDCYTTDELPENVEHVIAPTREEEEGN